MTVRRFAVNRGARSLGKLVQNLCNWRPSHSLERRCFNHLQPRLGIMVDIWLGILIAEKVAEAESKKALVDVIL